jgi:hypothetical protein
MSGRFLLRRLNRMRLALLAVLALGACRPVTTVEPEREFTLAVGQEARISGSDITLVIDSVANESRCPSDVTCIQAGDADVRLRVRDGQESSHTIHALKEPRSASFNGYTITLVELSPTPRSTVRIQQRDYRARLRLSR